jgi:hypothetical protein
LASLAGVGTYNFLLKVPDVYTPALLTRMTFPAMMLQSAIFPRPTLCGCLQEVPLRRMFFWTAVLGTALGLTQLVLITGAYIQLM